METQLLDWSLRAVLMAVGTAATLGALRVRTPAARRLAWIGVLVAMLLLPAMTTWGPKAPLPVLPAAREQLAPELPASEGGRTLPASQSVEDKRTSDASATRPSLKAEPPRLPRNWGWITLVCYFMGVGAMVIRMAIGAIQARSMIRQATFVDGARVSAQCASPVTVGWLRPLVVLPEGWRSWPVAKLDAVLTHEREHVRRRDPLVQWLALLNRAVFWFH